MITRNLKEIQQMCGGTGLKEKYKDTIITGVSTDSRNINHGQLFIPLIGENFNGHDFITMAIGKGAAASLWNKNETMPDIDFPLFL